LAQSGQYLAGLPYLKTALEADPSQGKHWLSYAEALLASGQHMEALIVIQTAMQNGLDSPEALAILQKAGAAVQDDHTTDISEMSETSVISDPANDQTIQLQNHLVALFNAGQFAELESQTRRFLEQRPDSGFAWKALGLALQNQGKDALPALQKATELLPNEAEVHNNLGSALHDLWRLDEAVESCCRALELNPDFAEAYNNLGIAQHDLGQFEAAAASCRRALEIKPDFAEAHYNFGYALHALGRLEEAMSSYRQALKLAPDFAKAHNNLGNALQSVGQLDSAVASYRRALEIKPAYADAHSNLIFALDLVADADKSATFGERLKWDAAHATPLWQEPSHSNDPTPARRLRVGYVSADFREHSAARVFGGMLTRYDRSQFEVFAYSNHKGKDDRFTELFRQNVTVWRSIAGLSDEAAADLVREDQVDILVDLSGHTAGNRLLVFARKPAPIQITAWGYATGTGMRAMDVFFTDPVMVPPQEKQYFSEALRYLPSVVGSFSPDPYPAVNELPALSEGIVTFGSLNRLEKVSEGAYGAWSEVLLAVPRSRLILKAPDLSEPTVRETVTGHFLKAGVAAERIILQGKTTWHEHMRAYHQIDIALDPFPHGGGVTALEGLMMGVPVVTLRWPTVVGRLSASIMTTLGLPDWIAESREEYVSLAVKKATDLESLAGLRRRLRIIFAASVIGDQEAYARVVEQEYRQLWLQWCGRQ